MSRKHDDVDLPRLCRSLYSARLALEETRRRRVEHVRLFAGAEWGNNSTPWQQPVNLIALYVRVILQNLIAQNPKFLLTTFLKEAKHIVSAMMTWMNRETKKMRLANTLERVAEDALYCMGIVKVALASPSDSAITGWKLSAGQPYARRIDFDDFVYDVHARDFEECSFICHRVRVPLRTITESKLYSKLRKELTADIDNPYNREGDERINMLFRGYITGTDEDYEDMIDLWEIYLPRHGLVVTIPDKWVTQGGASDTDEPLRVTKWLGPASGPYHILSYGDVPGNIQPKGTIPDLVPVHRSVNNAIRKLMEQAHRQKDNTFVQGQADSDGKRVIDANDGDIVRVDNPDKIHAVSQGGPNPGLFAFFTAMKEVFSYLGGNLDIAGGLSPQAKTATQDKMLDTNSSKSLATMQQRTVNYVSKVGEALGWYFHHHPQLTMDVTLEAPGAPEASTQKKITPEERQQIPFEEIDVEVNPYSLAFSTPQSRSAGLKSIFTQLIMPVMPLLQQQGIGVDMNALLDKIATYDDLPELNEILTITAPPDQGTQGGDQGGDVPAPSDTTRTYNRVNQSEKTSGGQAKETVAKMMGATGAQPAQMNGFA